MARNCYAHRNLNEGGYLALKDLSTRVGATQGHIFSELVGTASAAGILTACIPWATGVSDTTSLVSAFVVFTLAGLVICGRGRAHVFSGFCFVLAGFFCAYHFKEIISSGGEDWSMATMAGALVIGGLAVAIGVRAPWVAAVVTFLLFYGGGGLVSKSILSGGGVCWVYTPDSGGGQLVAAESCFVVENDGGELILVPHGYMGIMPLRPDQGIVGKKIGPYLIVGILEMGGIVRGVDRGKYAYLDFSMVSPGGGGKGGAVVRNPLWPAV